MPEILRMPACNKVPPHRSLIMGRISEKAFIRAYDELADEIFRFCVFRIKDRERAKDLMQDTFMRTWAYIAGGNEIENLKAFLYKTARNLSVNEAVRSKTLSLEELSLSGFEPEDTESEDPERLAEASLLMKYLADLRPEDQELLTLRYTNGLAVKEIGEILGLVPNTVSVRIHRAIQELKERMQPNTP